MVPALGATATAGGDVPLSAAASTLAGGASVESDGLPCEAASGGSLTSASGFGADRNVQPLPAIAQANAISHADGT